MSGTRDPRLSRKLMACGHGVRSVHAAEAHAPRVRRAMFYPNDAMDVRLGMITVAAQPLGASALFAAVLWYPVLVLKALSPRL